MSGSVSMEASRGLTAWISRAYQGDRFQRSVKLREIRNKVIEVLEVACCNRLAGDALNHQMNGLSAPILSSRFTMSSSDRKQSRGRSLHSLESVFIPGLLSQSK